jgi:hypothetical protein
MRGDRSRRNETREAVKEQELMSISVDSRSNSLIVAAPDSLFFEVQQLVTQLDQTPSTTNDSMRVVTIQRANPESVQRALAAIVGDALQTSAEPSGRDERAPSPDERRRMDRPDGPLPPPPTPEQIREQIRRRMEFFNLLQRAGQQGASRSGEGAAGRRDGRRGPGR